MELTFAARKFVNLCQCAFDKSRRSADKGDDPHPKDCTWTASNDCDGNACNVADADA